MEPKKAYASIRKNSIIFQLGHEKQTKKNPVKFFEMSSSTEAVYINNKKKKKHFLKLETIAYIQHPEIKLESKKECNEIYYPKQKEPRN